MEGAGNWSVRSLLFLLVLMKSMSESVAKNVEGYASERGLEGMAERYAEGARMGNLNRAISRSMVDIRNYTVMACVGLLSLLCSRSKNKNKDMVGILNFLLLFYAFSNVANSNSQGVRFYETAALLAVCFFIVFIAKSHHFKSCMYVQKRRQKTARQLIFYIIYIYIPYTREKRYNIIYIYGIVLSCCLLSS